MRRRIVSALRRRTWRFERGQRALLGVERMRAAEGDGLVAAGVAEGSAEDDGDVLAGEALGDDFLAARGVFGWSGVPHMEARVARLPPASGPSARPARAVRAVQLIGGGSWPKSSVWRRWSSPGSSPSCVHIGPWMEGTPARRQSSWRMVVSL